MNVFDKEFRGTFFLGEKHNFLNFIVPPNVNKSGEMIAHNPGPYDFSSANLLEINFAIDPTLRAFVTLTINVAGTTPGVTTTEEITDILNNNNQFSSYFIAYAETINRKTNQKSLLIRSRRPAQDIRAYISNSGAETKLRFNKKAGIAELPAFYDKHLISNGRSIDSDATLLRLDGTDTAVDLLIIREFLNNPDWSNNDLKKDYELFEGKSGLFRFKKQTVDGSDRITSIIEYPAGAKVGDLVRKTTYSYTSSNKNPDRVAEVPYVLQANDLITPP